MQNILVKVQENKKIYKLTDFGLSKVLEELDKEKEQTQGYMGTMIYSSPQILKYTYSAKCDIFSLGILFHYLIENNLHPYQQPGQKLCNIDIDNFNRKLKEEYKLKFSFKQYKRYGSFFEQLLTSMITYEEIKYNNILPDEIKVQDNEYIKSQYKLENNQIIKRNKIQQRNISNIPKIR